MIQNTFNRLVLTKQSLSDTKTHSDDSAASFTAGQDGIKK